MKTIGFMPKRADITRAAFREHYETRHAPLALKYFPFQKYVRNHVVASDPDPIGFDCLSEFWVDDVAEIHRLMASEVGDTMREDERRFTNQEKIGPGVATETHVAGPPRIVDDSFVKKEILLLRRTRGVSAEAFAETAIRWGQDLADNARGRLTRVTFDAVVPFEGRNFPPCDGILYGWTGSFGGVLYDAVPPAGIEIYGRIKTDSVETRFP